jgi:hypothetical protein
MEIIVETSTAWSSRRLYKFYKNKKFIKDFVEAFSTDDEVTRFIYANAFYLRVKYEGKPISEKIPMGEITEIIMSEFNEFMDCASDSIKFSPDPEDIFNFIACDGIYNEMDAVLSLRDELACSLDGLSGMHFHSLDIDVFSKEFSNFYKYNPAIHQGKKLAVYKDWIMSNIDALSFIGGSMYLQEIIDPDSEMDFDIFYEHISNFIYHIMDSCDIDHDSKVNKTTFSRDLKKIFKFIYKNNRDLSL